MTDVTPAAEPGKFEPSKNTPERFSVVVGALAMALAVVGLAGWWPQLVAGAPPWLRAIPAPVALASAFVGLALSRPRGRARRLALALCATHTVSFLRDAAPQRSVTPADNRQIRVVQWSMESNRFDRAIYAELFRDLPHVALLHRAPEGFFTEGRRGQFRPIRFFHAVKSGAWTAHSRHRMDRLELPDIDGLDMLFARINDPAGAYYVFALAGASRAPSAPQIEAVARFLRKESDCRPLVIAVGRARERTDAAWRPLKSLASPAFERAGFGWPYTYPALCPLYARDHLWISREFAIHKAGYRLGPAAAHLRAFAVLSRKPEFASTKGEN